MNWERPENNESGKEPKVGMIVSVGSMFVSALAAGSVFVLGLKGRGSSWLWNCWQLVCSVSMPCSLPCSALLMTYGRATAPSPATLPKPTSAFCWQRPPARWWKAQNCTLQSVRSSTRNTGSPREQCARHARRENVAVDDFLPENPTRGRNRVTLPRHCQHPRKCWHYRFCAIPECQQGFRHCWHSQRVADCAENGELRGVSIRERNKDRKSVGWIDRRSPGWGEILTEYETWRRKPRYAVGIAKQPVGNHVGNQTGADSRSLRQ